MALGGHSQVGLGLVGVPPVQEVLPFLILDRSVPSLGRTNFSAFNVAGAAPAAPS